MSAREAIRALLSERGEGKTICPSEAARRMTDGDSNWRDNMEAVHKAADAMRAAGEIIFMKGGEPIDQRRGAYRIARR